MKPLRFILGWSWVTWLAVITTLLLAGAWLASQRGLVRLSDGSRWSVFVGAGRFGVETYTEFAEAAELTPRPGLAVWRFTDDAAAAWPDTQNTHAWITVDNTSGWLTRWTIQFWPGVLALPLLAAWRLRREVPRQRARHNCCPRCGYPREGLAPETPCPECGHARPTSASAR